MKSTKRFHNISSTKITLHKNKYNSIHSSQCHLKNRSKTILQSFGGVKKYNPILIHSNWPSYKNLSWTYGSWTYNDQCNQCLSPIKLRVRILLRWGVLDILCDKVCQWLATGRSVVFYGFLLQHWQSQYKWNIVESGVKHHNPNPISVLLISQSRSRLHKDLSDLWCERSIIYPVSHNKNIYLEGGGNRWL